MRIVCVLIVVSISLLFSFELPAQPSEQDLFLRPGKKKKHPNISLNLGLNFVNETIYYNGLLSRNVDEFYEIVPTINGYYAFSKDVSLSCRVPFHYRGGFIDIKGPLPGLVEHKTRSGFGDISFGLSFIKTSRKIFPTNIIIETNSKLPTGVSRFDDLYDGYLDLGNGFQTLSFGAGINTFLTPNLLVYTNWGFTSRFDRSFERTIATDAGLYTETDEIEVTFSPESITLFRVGIGFLFFKGIAMNYELERVQVGAVSVDQQYLFNHSDPQVRSIYDEEEFSNTRFGVKLVSVEQSSFAPIIFLGFDRFENKNSFVVSLNYLAGIHIFGLNF